MSEIKLLTPDELSASRLHRFCKMKIYCCYCGVDVDARLTNGCEIYRHRADLKSLPFWKCDACGNFVGCHHKTANRTLPLGCIPTPEIKNARKHIHALLDPIWQSGRIGRRELYKMIGQQMGSKQYHTAEIRSVDEARTVYRIVKKIADVRRTPPTKD